jgi:hypothetical protein
LFWRNYSPRSIFHEEIWGKSLCKSGEICIMVYRHWLNMHAFPLCFLHELLMSFIIERRKKNLVQNCNKLFGYENRMEYWMRGRDCFWLKNCLKFQLIFEVFFDRHISNICVNAICLTYLPPSYEHAKMRPRIKSCWLLGVPLYVRLWAVPHFPGFRYICSRVWERKGNEGVQTTQREKNMRCPHNAKFPLVEIDVSVNPIW